MPRKPSPRRPLAAPPIAVLSRLKDMTPFGVEQTTKGIAYALPYPTPQVYDILKGLRRRGLVAHHPVNWIEARWSLTPEGSQLLTDHYKQKIAAKEAANV